MNKNMCVEGHMGWYDRGFVCHPHSFAIIHDLLKIEETMKYHDPKYYASLHWSRIFEYPWVYTMLNLKKDDVVLDLGGGWGPFQFLLAQECKWVHNFDMDEGIIPFLDVGKRILGLNNVTLTLGNAENGLPYEDCYFDKVAFISVLEHMNPPYQRYMDDIIRVTKVGGIISCTFDVFVNPREREEVSMATAKTLCDYLGIRWVDIPPLIPYGAVDPTKPFAVMTINLVKVKSV